MTHFSACATLVGAAPSASIPVEMIRMAGLPRLVNLAKEAGPHIDYFPARSLCINTIANCVSVTWGHLSLRKNVLALFRSKVAEPRLRCLGVPRDVYGRASEYALRRGEGFADRRRAAVKAVALTGVPGDIHPNAKVEFQELDFRLVSSGMRW